VLKFSTNHAIIEQILVEPSLDLPLSQEDSFVVPCDKDDLYVDTYAISNTCDENRHFLHIDSDVDELKLLSSLNTLGYIEFDDLCNLSYLEKNLFAYADLPWLSRHTYHVIGKYNNKE
jgi:hypothetical protein